MVTRQASLLKQEGEQAQRQVARFVLRFEPAYLQLAYYAALPLVITPELLHYLRNQFLREQALPWVAEADLLLSDLCYPVGYEQYAMDVAVRAYLTAEMERELGPEHLQAVAKLLLRYVEQQESLNPYLSSEELQAQQMAAMVYVGEAQQAQVAHTLAEEYQAAVAVGGGGQRLSVGAQAKMAQISRLVEELAPKLQAYQPLLEFAQVISQLLTASAVVSAERLGRTYEVGDGIALQVPEDLLPTQSQSVLSLPGFPPLETFDFIDAQLADVEGEPADTFPPPLQSEEFTVVTFQEQQDVEPPTVEIVSGRPVPNAVEPQPFDFTVATLHQQTTAQEPVKKAQEPSDGASDEWLVQRQQQRAYRWIELLPGDCRLEMVEIPAGSFMMGSPNDEPEGYEDEAPQHEVTVEPFYMGRYPVTQAQWRAVANLPQVAHELEADPSEYKGDLRPVEQVSWHDAVEFCARLSAHTGREYRLPTEAEWEYACRAGTTTPFHFGDMITTEVANYDGSPYADGPEGENRGETMPVDHFEIANAFGLSDMHGNVEEWCADHWHSNYDGAPNDGSAWLTDNEAAGRVWRGGSWIYVPRFCRSAYRIGITPEDRFSYIGFRVSCAAPRTP